MLVSRCNCCVPCLRLNTALRLELQTPDEQEELQSIEDSSQVAVIQVWRRLALKQLNDEAERRAAAEPVKKSWFGGSGKSKFKGLSQEQQKILFEAIDFNPGTADEAAITLPPEFVKTRVQMHLASVTISLLKDTVPLADFDLQSIAVNVDLLDGSMVAKVKLESLSISDQCSQKTAFRHIISKDEARCDPGAQLLDLVFVQNPLGCDDDMQVRLLLQPLRIVFNPFFVESLLGFAVLGNDIQLDPTLQEGLSNSARGRMLALKRNTEIQMTRALNVRTAVDIDITLRAPTIFVPNDCSAEAAKCLRIELGDLMVKNGAPTRTHDSFEIALKDMQVQLCDHHRGGSIDNFQQLVGKSSLEVQLSTSARVADVTVPKLIVDKGH